MSEKPKRVLKRKVRSADKARATGVVRAVFPFAIEVGGLVARVKGLGVMGGLVAFVAASMQAFVVFVWDPPKSGLDGFTVFFYFMTGSATLLFSVIGLCFFRSDLFAYRDEPLLFDRQNRKVHVFRHERRWRKPFSAWPARVTTYAWDNVTGEVHGGVQPIGASTVAVRYRLFGVVKDGEGRQSADKEERFIIGPEESSVSDCVARWEHIRRYMEENGPAVSEQDDLKYDRRFSHRQALAIGLWVLHEGFYDNFAQRPTWPVLGTVLQILLLPLCLLIALASWLARASSRDPRWPREVLESLGGPALSDASVLAMSSAKRVPAEVM